VTTPSIGLAWRQERAARPARPARTPLLLLFVAWAARRLPAASKVRTAFMQVTAFGFACYAAFLQSTFWGCITVAASLLILEALSDKPRR
jgi:hypothetical protein